MEINEKVIKLLKSEIESDKRVALEILKEGKFDNFEYLMYEYRYHLSPEVIWDYFNYKMLNGTVPCKSTSGKMTYTAVKLIGWK